MRKYLTRVRERERDSRSYTWSGRSRRAHRKLHTCEYQGICIRYKEESVSHSIELGDFILIKSDDDERPYVAKLLKLYDGGTKDQPTKCAEVQWFVRFEEIPKFKQKLLGREPHPQEIFLYEARDCDNEISAETILRTVKVLMIAPNEQFLSVKQSSDTLFAKLSWNGKVFNPLPSFSGRSSEAPQLNRDCAHGNPHAGQLKRSTKQTSEVDAKLVPKSQHVARDILCSLAPLSPVSGGRVFNSRVSDLKSHSSISKKNSASKYSCSTEKQRQTATTPGKSSLVRKRLQLSSPSKSRGTKLKGQDVLCELLHDDEDDDEDEEEDEEEEDFDNRASVSREQQTPKRKVTFNSLACDVSPSKKLRNGIPGNFALLPIKGLNLRTDCKVDILCINPIRLNSKANQADSPTRARSTEGHTDLHKKHSEISGSLSRSKSSRTSKCESQETPKRNSTTQTRINKKEQKNEAENIISTPRSQRSSARQCSMRLKEQLKDDEHDVGDASEDEFLPAAEQSSESSSENEEEELESLMRASRRKSTPRTPRSTAKMPVNTSARISSSRTPKSPGTPHHPIPAIPSRRQPVTKPVSVLEEARARLHVSAVPESLPCREQEFQDVYNFIESKVIDGTGGCMYISGVPGTGKTATVHEVMRCLSHAAEQEELPIFQFIEINGMKLTDPHQAYVQILKLLTGQKATADHAAALLEKRFSTPAAKRETTVLLVDELDLLWTRKQNVMYNLFDWPTRKQAKLVVLAIANTMDLPERIMINRVASRLGLTRMSFQPYTYKQLQQIIASRLNRLKAFEDDVIQLVARKVAALSGDARRALDICRRSAEICEISSAQKSASSMVRMVHVTQALDEMFSSPYITAIRNSSVQEQIFLQAVIAEFKQLGVEEATFQQVYQQHMGLCRMEGLQPPAISEAMSVCMRLGACRLLLVESSKNDLHSRVRLNVSQDDVMYALKQD
eukprot:gi/632963907/ref/XP_007898140.1/ PREDICTED: origin recognition complex subunit 1 [Callorhinchus milii]